MNMLEILKFRLGISTNKRDDYLKAIIKGTVSELNDVYGIKVKEDESGVIKAPDHLSMLIVDLAEFRYTSRGENVSMPEHLRFRIRNLYSKGKLNANN